jgi:hypothetical protein
MQIAEAVKLFDGVSGKEFLPLQEIDHDPVRRELDEKFARDVLGPQRLSSHLTGRLNCSERS